MCGSLLLSYIYARAQQGSQSSGDRGIIAVIVISDTALAELVATIHISRVGGGAGGSVYGMGRVLGAVGITKCKKEFS